MHTYCSTCEFEYDHSKIGRYQRFVRVDEDMVPVFLVAYVLPSADQDSVVAAVIVGIVLNPAVTRPSS